MLTSWPRPHCTFREGGDGVKRQEQECTGAIIRPPLFPFHFISLERLATLYTMVERHYDT